MIALRLPPAPAPAISCSPASPRYRYCDSIAANGKKLCRFRQKVKAVLQPKEAAAQQEDEDGNGEDNEQDEDFQVLTAVQTSYNRIVIVDTSKSRLLLLDNTRMYI